MSVALMTAPAVVVAVGPTNHCPIETNEHKLYINSRTETILASDQPRRDEDVN